MAESQQQQAERAAQLVLQLYKDDHPEWQDDRAPVEALVTWLELHIATFMPGDYASGTYGFIDPDQDEHLIWLCKDLPETLHRFTLAHEMGHAILHCRGNELIEVIQAELKLTLADEAETQHWQRSLMPTRDDPCSIRDIQDDMVAYAEQAYVQEWLGSNHAYDPRSQHELAANAFAAELLMPRERLQTLYLQGLIPPQQLADHFAVSRSALLNRLAELFPPSVGTDVSHPQADTSRPQADASRPLYDEFQLKAIEASTPALITAGPGSGKTSTLIGRVAYLVRTLHVSPMNILALTFSRKAAQEMEERLQGVLIDMALPTPTVSTFHAFCADLLRQYGDLVGLRADFTLVDEAEGYFTLLQLSSRIPLRHYQHLTTPTLYFTEMLKAISRAKDELVSPETYAQFARVMLLKAQALPQGETRVEQLERAERALEIAEVYRLYEEALEQRGDTDFGGLLVLAVRLLNDHPDILREQQEAYQHILVDEFQDMNRASGVLLRILAGEARRAWVVGDANQAIYGFRGASPANISQFHEDCSS